MPRSPKPDPFDDPQPRPAPEPLFDQTTLQKLDALKVPDPDEPPQEPKTLDLLPEDKRQEVTQILRARYQRMRRYLHGEATEVDW